MNQINESSLSRIHDHTQKHDYGTITAFRYAKDCGSGEVYKKSENKQRNKVLLGKLRSKGYSVTSIKGAYIENFGTKNAKEVKEDSFLVVDIKDSGKLKKDLRSLGKEFEQDSILFGSAGEKPVLIGTNACPDSYPGLNSIIKLGKGLFGKAGEFLSRVHGRPFVFEAEEVTEYPPVRYPTELRGPVAHSKEEYE